MKAPRFAIAFLLMCWLLTPLLTQAQDPDLELSESFRTESGDLRFDYPQGWATCDCAPGLTYLYSDPDLNLQLANPATLKRGQVVITFLREPAIQSFGWDIGQMDQMTAVQILEAMLESNPDPGEFGDIETFGIRARPAAKVSIPESGLEFWALKAAQGRNLLILVSTHPQEQGGYEALLLELLGHLEYGQGLAAGESNGSTYRFPDSDLYLDHGSNWRVMTLGDRVSLINMDSLNSFFMETQPVESYARGASTDWEAEANKLVSWTDSLPNIPSTSSLLPDQPNTNFPLPSRDMRNFSSLPAEEIQIGEWQAWAAYLLSDVANTLYLLINVDDQYIIILTAVDRNQANLRGVIDDIREGLRFYVR